MWSSHSLAKSSLALLIGLSSAMLWMSSTSERLGGFTSTISKEEAVNSNGREVKAPESYASQSVLTNTDKRTRARVTDSYGKLPLSFEANQGQFDSRVQFASRGRGYSLFLTANVAVMTLSKSLRGENMQEYSDLRPLAVRRTAKLQQYEQPGPGSSDRTQRDPRRRNVLRMELVGANSSPIVEQIEQLPGKSNYFIGNDPKKWRTGIANYVKVRYRSVYKGIDLVYHGEEGKLEYDFNVAPGANPKAIKLLFQSAERMRIDKNGDLVLAVSGGEFRQHKPLSYQEVDGARKEIASRYVMRGRCEASLEVEHYDATKPLLIDPVLTYSTYLGGSSEDVGKGIAVDASGNAYVTGFADSSDFPMATSLQPAYGGFVDAFVTKLNASGTALIYSTYLGGNNFDMANSIALDPQGNAYVTGQTLSTNFPTVNAIQPSYGRASSDGFVAKLNSTGTAILYSTYLGGNGFDEGQSIAADAGGSAYVTGRTSSTNFPTATALQPSFNGVNDIFVSKLNPAGTAFVYSTYLGGVGSESVAKIATDSSGNAYVAGSTISPDFPTVNALQPVFKGKTVFKSSNGGVSWADINNGLSPHFSVTAIAVNPVLPSTLYAGTSLRNLFKSTDGGSSWTGINTGLQIPPINVKAIAVNPLTPTTLFVGAVSGLFRSTDGGMSWATSNLFNVSSIAIDPVNTSNVYAGLRDFMAKSTDGGETFALIRVRPDNFFNNVGNLEGLAIDPATPSTLYAGGSSFVFKSTDGGFQWSVKSNGLFFQPVSALAIDRANTSTLFAGTTYNVFKSTDGGESWRRAGSNLSPRARSLVIDPAATSTVFAGTFGSGVFKSTNGGDTWAEAREGLRNSFVIALAIDPGNTAVLYSGNLAINDGFVLKLNQNASALLYSTYLGGDDPDFCSAIAVDASGNVYVTGQTDSSNFPTVNSLQSHVGNTTDSFVSKINAAGTALIYSTYLGGNNTDSASGIAIDSSGNAYVIGSTDSSDFPLVAALQSSLGDPFGDAFITKLNPSGTAVVYSTYFGGRRTNQFTFDQDLGNAIALDVNGHAYITGETFSASLPTTPGAFQVTQRDIQPEAFVAKITDTPAFGICLQDETNGSTLQVNTATGEYQFVSCSGVTVAGTSAITRRGCLITLQVNGPDRRLLARVDPCMKSGTATLQIFSQGATFTILDRNTANNKCVCAGG